MISQSIFGGNSGGFLVTEACRYIEELGWWLVPVAGHGANAKKPLYRGWPDYRPDAETIKSILTLNGDAGIGLNLGGSGLLDLEADSPEAEEFLDDLCKDIECPSWQSRRGKHRLFQANGCRHLDITAMKIEFRSGRHQSVLPPSVFGETEYRWIVDPFDCPPPPLPDKLLDFYKEQEHKPGNKRDRPRSPVKNSR